MFFVGSHYLEVDVVESSNKHPQLIVVETPECSKESEESLEEERALFLVERVQKAGPGDHRQGDCTRNLRKKEMFFVFVDVSANAVLTLKAFNAYWVLPSARGEPWCNCRCSFEGKVERKGPDPLGCICRCLSGEESTKDKILLKMIIVEEPSTPHKCLVVCRDRSTW